MPTEIYSSHIESNQNLSFVAAGSAHQLRARDGNRNWSPLCMKHPLQDGVVGHGQTKAPEGLEGFPTGCSVLRIRQSWLCD